MREGDGDLYKAEGIGDGEEVQGYVVQLVREGGGRDGGGSCKFQIPG